MVSVLDLMKDGESRNNFVDRTSQRRPVALKWRLPTTFHISHFSQMYFCFKKNIRVGVGTPYTLLSLFSLFYTVYAVNTVLNHCF